VIEKIALDAYVIDTLLADLVGHDRRIAAFAVYLYLWRHTWGAGAGELNASHQTIASDTGLSKSAVQVALRHLRRRKLIETQQEFATATPRHRVLRPWRRKAAAK
jgi:predicted transcriptional regulator